MDISSIFINLTINNKSYSAPVQVRGNSLTDQAESYSIEFFDDPA